MNYQKELLAIVHKYVPDCTVYLFGSRARNSHHMGSDIDLAIDAKKSLDIGLIGMIKEECAQSSIPLFVDVVDLNSIDDDMKKEIMKDAVIWSN